MQKKQQLLPLGGQENLCHVAKTAFLVYSLEYSKAH
jgi:hypothetical protein